VSLIYRLRSSQSRDTLCQLLCSRQVNLLLQYMLAHSTALVLCAQCSVLCACARSLLREARSKEKKGIGSDINMFEQTDRWPASSTQEHHNPTVDISLQEASVNLLGSNSTVPQFGGALLHLLLQYRCKVASVKRISYPNLCFSSAHSGIC
jgi:hypothetical protein